MTAGELASECGVGVSTVHDYRARGILKPSVDHGQCRYSSTHIGVLRAVLRLKSDEFRRRKAEIEHLAQRISQEQFAALDKMPRKRVEALLEKFRLR
jgi:DNA-binding transcriptional MerR regulator